MPQGLPGASELPKASRCVPVAVVRLNDLSFALSKYFLGTVGSRENGRSVRCEKSVELGTHALGLAHPSELTFEAGNPAVVGTYVPVDRKLCVPTFR